MMNFKTLIVFLCASLCLAVRRPHTAKLKKHQKIRPIRPFEPSALFPIRYKMGGKVLTERVNIYLIYYGNWTSLNQEIVDTFVSNLGASDWYTTNTEYYQQNDRFSEKEFVKPDVVLAQKVVDSNYTFGYTIRNAWKTVEYYLDEKILPLDANGVYYLLPSDDVDTEGFCNSWCGWHDFQGYKSHDVFYGYIGVPPAWCTGCSANDGKVSVNDAPMIDALVDTLAHEIVEAISDPKINAWMDLRGQENGDKCNWHYGKTKKDDNGANYNVILGDRKYLIQQNWSPINQTCVGGF